MEEESPITSVRTNELVVTCTFIHRKIESSSDQPIILYIGEELLTPISPTVGMVLPAYGFAMGIAFDAA